MATKTIHGGIGKRASKAHRTVHPPKTAPPAKSITVMHRKPLRGRFLTTNLKTSAVVAAPSSGMVHVRVSNSVKVKAEKALRSMGLSVSDAVRVLLVRVAAERKLPFEVRVPNLATRKAMQELTSNPNLPRFKGVDALFADLNDEEPASTPTHSSHRSGAR